MGNLCNFDTYVEPWPGRKSNRDWTELDSFHVSDTNPNQLQSYTIEDCTTFYARGNGLYVDKPTRKFMSSNYLVIRSRLEIYYWKKD